MKIIIENSIVICTVTSKSIKMRVFVVFIVSKSSSLWDGAGHTVKKTGQSRAEGKGVERG
jgi:hypothetical protein